MRVAVVQTNPIFGEVKKNIQNALDLMDTGKADIYVLPELFNTGYNFIDKQEVQSLAEPIQGETYKAVEDWVKKNKCYVVYGFPEIDNLLFNSSAFVGPEGLVGRYRKVHLYYRENIYFTPGNLGFPVFDLPIGRIGMMICFDWMYPESARSLALNGAQLVAHPANLVLPHCPDAMVTRCLENKIYCATADRIGTENRGNVNLTFIGKSEIVAPTGEILCRLGTDECSIAIADIVLSDADKKNINKHNDLLQGRRTDQYTI